MLMSACHNEAFEAMMMDQTNGTPVLLSSVLLKLSLLTTLKQTIKSGADL